MENIDIELWRIFEVAGLLAAVQAGVGEGAAAEEIDNPIQIESEEEPGYLRIFADAKSARQ